MAWYARRTRVATETWEDHAHALEAEITGLHEELMQPHALTKNPKAVLQDLGKGEGQTIEFKASCSEQNDAIKSLCAFANAVGGTVCLGVGDNGDVLGLAETMGRKTIENFANRIKTQTNPPMTPIIEVVDLKGKMVCFASISGHKAGELYFAFDRPMIRVGKTNQVMSPDQMRGRLLEVRDSSTDDRRVQESLESGGQGGKRPVGELRVDVDWHRFRERREFNLLSVVGVPNRPILEVAVTLHPTLPMHITKHTIERVTGINPVFEIPREVALGKCEAYLKVRAGGQSWVSRAKAN